MKFGVHSKCGNPSLGLGDGASRITTGSFSIQKWVRFTERTGIGYRFSGFLQCLDFFFWIGKKHVTNIFFPADANGQVLRITHLFNNNSKSQLQLPKWFLHIGEPPTQLSHWIWRDIPFPKWLPPRSLKLPRPIGEEIPIFADLPESHGDSTGVFIWNNTAGAQSCRMWNIMVFFNPIRPLSLGKSSHFERSQLTYHELPRSF